jgi:hypothetical protein
VGSKAGASAIDLQLGGFTDTAHLQAQRVAAIGVKRGGRTSLRHSASTGIPLVTVRPKAVMMVSLDNAAMIALLMRSYLTGKSVIKKARRANAEP